MESNQRSRSLQVELNKNLRDCLAIVGTIQKSGQIFLNSHALQGKYNLVRIEINMYASINTQKQVYTAFYNGDGKISLTSEVTNTSVHRRTYSEKQGDYVQVNNI